MSADFFKKALRAHQAGDLRSASELYQKFLQRAPREYNALQLLGGVFHAQGDNNTALKYLQASLKINPDQPQVMLNVATCQRQLKNYTGALETLSKLIRRDSANFGAFKSRMFVLVEMGDYERAYRELDAQIHKFPAHFELYNLMGAVASECEHFQKAKKAYQKALKIRPNSDVARHNLGLAYCQNGEPEKALKEYHIVLNSGKHSYQLMHNLGTAYLDLGHYEQATTYFNNALKLNYKSLDSHKKLSDTLWQSGDSKHFVRNFESALKKFPADSRFLFEYVRRLFQVKRFKDARESLDKHLTELQSNAEFQYLYGKCCELSGEAAEALSWFDKARVSNALSDSDKLDICRSLVAANKEKDAEKIADSILEHQPEHTSALAWRGVCLRKSGDSRESELNNYTALIREYQLFNPAQDSNFYRSLVETLTRLHLAHEELIDKSSHNGTQTRRHLFKTDNSALLELSERFKAAVGNYIEEQTPSWKWGNLPNVESFEISNAWSVRLKENGYHKAHIHPNGKISGIFFVTVPRHRDKNLPPWSLQFGKPPIDDPRLDAQKMIVPEVGKLLIFPSWFWHNSIKQTLPGQKLTISFDINTPKFSA